MVSIYEMESSDFAGMAARERSVSIEPEKMMAVLGAQLWFLDYDLGESVLLI